MRRSTRSPSSGTATSGRRQQHPAGRDAPAPARRRARRRQGLHARPAGRRAGAPGAHADRQGCVGRDEGERARRHREPAAARSPPWTSWRRCTSACPSRCTWSATAPARSSMRRWCGCSQRRPVPSRRATWRARPAMASGWTPARCGRPACTTRAVQAGLPAGDARRQHRPLRPVRAGRQGRAGRQRRAGSTTSRCCTWCRTPSRRAPSAPARRILGMEKWLAADAGSDGAVHRRPGRPGVLAQQPCPKASITASRSTDHGAFDDDERDGEGDAGAHPGRDAGRHRRRPLPAWSSTSIAPAPRCAADGSRSIAAQLRRSMKCHPGLDPSSMPRT